ncbi:MAG: LysR family transcriptional regulator [Rhizobiaceae bacterium]
MELRQLRYFSQIAALQNFSKASETLCIAQPALSRQIRLLEEELGTKLFDRNSAGVTLTEAGERFLLHARLILRQTEYARDSVSDDGLPRGIVAIGATDSIAELLYPEVVSVVRDLYPHVTLHLAASTSAHLIDRMERNELDLAIVSSGVTPTTIQAEFLCDEDLYLVGGSDDPRLDVGKVLVSELPDFPLILSSRRNRSRRDVEDLAIQLGAKLNIVAEVEHLHTIIDLIECKIGYSFLPFSAVAKRIRPGGLSGAPLHDLRQSCYLASRIASQSSAVGVVKVEVQKALSSLIAAGDIGGRLKP